MAEFITTAEAALELGLSLRGCQDLIVRGVLPARRLTPTGPWAIRRADLPLARKRPGRGRPRKIQDQA